MFSSYKATGLYVMVRLVKYSISAVDYHYNLYLSSLSKFSISTAIFTMPRHGALYCFFMSQTPVIYYCDS